MLLFPKCFYRWDPLYIINIRMRKVGIKMISI